jgi:hypothetical protein
VRDWTLVQASKTTPPSFSNPEWRVFICGAHTRGEARLEAGDVQKDVGLPERDQGNDAMDAD